MIESIEDRKNKEMKYSIEPRDRKYIDRFLLKGFLLFGKSAAKKFGDQYLKRILDTATKTGMEAGKAGSKRAEASRDLIGNKIADKITLVGKSKKGPKNVVSAEQ